MTDMVNHPPHYTHGKIECIDAIESALGPAGFQAYCRGVIIKYSWRVEHKGAAAQDLGKIGWYAERARQARGNAKFVEQPTEADIGAMRDGLEHAAAQARKDAAEIERLKLELGRFQGRTAFVAKIPANAVGEAMQALGRAVEATRGITFAADGEIARQIVDCQNLTQALICRIGRI
jgi:hypothetical protein